MKTGFLLILATLGVTMACGGDDGEGEAEVPEVDCATVTVPRYAELTFLQDSCAHCHGADKEGPARQEAPVSINFDTIEAAKPFAKEAVEELYEDPPAMPPASANLPAVTEAQRSALNAWAQCGTPE